VSLEQRNRGTEEQRNRGTEEQRNRGTEEQRNRGTEEQRNRGTEEQSHEHVDYLRKLTEKEDAETREQASEDRIAEEQQKQQREIIASPQGHQKDPDRASLRSALFGLRFLQDMKGEPAEITGVYDPKQERWVMEKQVKKRELPDPTSRSTYRETVNNTWSSTNTGGGRDRDSDRDMEADDYSDTRSD
jgi:hypothetical protein